MVKSAWAEYRLLPAAIVRENVFHIPDHISFRSAALLEPLGSAVHGITDADIQLMDTVVINGAGPLGLMMTKLAKLRGAYVISTDKNAKRLGVARELGADVTIDISETEDVVEAVKGLTPCGRGVDIAIDATGVPEVWEKNLYMVRKAGTVLEFGGCRGGSRITGDTTLLHYSQLTVKGVYHTTPKLEEQAFRLIERGIISEDLFVNDTYPLEQCLDALNSHAGGEVIKNEIRCDL